VTKNVNPEIFKMLKHSIGYHRFPHNIGKESEQLALTGGMIFINLVIFFIIWRSRVVAREKQNHVSSWQASKCFAQICHGNAIFYTSPFARVRQWLRASRSRYCFHSSSRAALHNASYRFDKLKFAQYHSWPRLATPCMCIWNFGYTYLHCSKVLLLSKASFNQWWVCYQCRCKENIYSPNPRA